jgi:hypothetical protein
LSHIKTPLIRCPDLSAHKRAHAHTYRHTHTHTNIHIHLTHPHPTPPTHRDNLLPDFEPYKDAPYKVSDLSALLEKLIDGRPPKHLTLLLVKGGRVTALPMTEKPPTLTAKRVRVCVRVRVRVRVCVRVCVRVWSREGG